MTDQDALRAAVRLRTAVDRLPRELRPQRDLWPEIAGRLGERDEPGHRPAPFEERRPANSWWRVAAAVTLLAGGLLTAVALAPEAPPPEAPSAPPMAAAEAAPAPITPVLAAPILRQRDGVLQAHGDLVAAAARRRGGLDAAGAVALTEGLADLERAVTEIEAALAAHPNDRRLRLALAAAYRRESAWASRWAGA